MPGRLRTSFRSGNLAEDLGVLLLRGLAAVADVPRPEDVGLDAVATLLRRDSDGNCYAEDTFVVQLKSESQQSVEFRDHALTWLLQQTQPMFIGRVSLADSRIRLYSTLRVNHAVLALHAKQVTVQFGCSDLPGLLSDKAHWVGHGEDSANVWLGEPVLEWTAAFLSNRDWQLSAYETLKLFLTAARREIELCRIGQWSRLEWSTNDKDSIRTKGVNLTGHPDELERIANDAIPYLNALLLRVMSLPPERADRVAIPLVALLAGLETFGAIIDRTMLKVGALCLFEEQRLSLAKEATETPGK